ncbi:glycosyltransferase family 4 protein [Alphaproteobacteria bacterium]|nr:glycosyltransferase family 4 protein [Alphaproteobacteria bacterium]
MNLGIVFVTSHPMSVVAFMLPHIRALKSLMPVQVFANSNERTLLQQRGVDVPIYFVPIVRPIAPWSDIQALWILYWQFKKNRLMAVHTITPKAGLLGMLAAWLARVPVRVHSFTGQVWVTRTGFMRRLLKAADELIAAMATDVLVDSPSQQDFLIEQGVVTAKGSSVLGFGSICGVNTQRFSPNKSVREVVRDELGTASDAIVCLYLGRLNHDKGVLDLASACAQVLSKHPKAELWVVGPDEADYFLQMQAILGRAVNNIKRVDYTPTPERFMQAANLFCMPSYREGFGSSVIEAAACEVPTLTSRIYGLTDAVVEGQTGWMYKAGDIQELAQQLDRLLANPAELDAKGQAARQYVKSFFAEEIVTDAMRNFYEHRISQVLRE